MQRLEIYRQMYQYSKKSCSYKSIQKYIETLKTQKKNLYNNQNPLNKINGSVKQLQNQMIQKIDFQYNQQILKVISDHLQKNRQQDFFLMPGLINFHFFLLQIYFKTGSYQMIINYFLKLAQFIKQLTKIHNKSHVSIYKKQVVRFVDQSFFKINNKKFTLFALYLFISTQNQQISMYYPQILYFYCALIVANRRYVMTKIVLAGLLKIIKLIDFLCETTKKQIKQMIYVLMVGITEEWEIVKKNNGNINDVNNSEKENNRKVNLIRKKFYIKAMRSSNYCQYYHFQQRYMSKKVNKFDKIIIKKLQTIKKT